METHRFEPRDGTRREDPPTRRRRAAAPIDADWLEREALRYVARWESTRRGVEALLARRLDGRAERGERVPESLRKAIPVIVDSLVRRGYVDDRRFAAQALHRLRRQGRSANAIRRHLAQRGVPEALVEALLLEREAQTSDEDALPGLDDELAAAWQTARKRRLGPFRGDSAERAERRERDLGVLARRGFSSEVAYRVIDGEPEGDPGAGAGSPARAHR